MLAAKSLTLFKEIELGTSRAFLLGKQVLRSHLTGMDLKLWSCIILKSLMN